MKKGILLIVMAAFFSLLSISAQTSFIEKLSVDIYNRQMVFLYGEKESEPWLIKEGEDFYQNDSIKYSKCRPAPQTWYELRNISHEYEKLDYEIESDTVFIIERRPSEGPIWTTTVYSMKDTLQYYMTGFKEIKYREKPSHDYFQLNLIRKWDIEELHRLSKDPRYYYYTPGWVYVTRIIFRKGNYKIDCMGFQDFWFESEKK